MKELGFLIGNTGLIVIASTIFIAVIYFLDDKKNTSKNIERESIKKRNWTYIGNTEHLSFYPKPIIILGVITFWGVVLFKFFR